MSQSTKEQNWTVGRLMEWTTHFLAKKGLESAHLDARILLAQVLGCKPIDLFGLRYSEIATDEARSEYRKLIQRRLEGCPAAYLVGRKEFFSLEFDITPEVLIPRPDSELVVAECLTLAKNLSQPTILDVGTGSGNLAVALAHNLAAAKVTAVDSSEAALQVAAGNAAKHDVAERILFLRGDVFSPLDPEMRFDFIVSNPPYIPTGDMSTLPAGVRDYEPHTALDGGSDGFAVFDRMIAEAPRFLGDEGYLLIEIGAPQESAARQRLEGLGCYDLSPTIHDAAGHPRVLRARLRRDPPEKIA